MDLIYYVTIDFRIINTDYRRFWSEEQLGKHLCSHDVFASK